MTNLHPSNRRAWHICEHEWSKTCNQSFLLSQEYQAYIGAEKEKGHHYVEPLKHQENDEEHQILHRELYS
jgi:hypothetical protein